MLWWGIEWQDCNPPVEESVIGQIEKALNVSLPPDYKECIRFCHGGRPTKKVFSFFDPDIGAMESCIGVLLSLSEDDDESVLETYARLSKYLPDNAVPIADDGGGDFVCLDFSAGERPTVGYWPHGEQKLIPLANTFSEFLDLLHE